MGIFKKIDGFVVAGFQWIVNKTGRKPRWFCKQLAVLLALSAIMRPFEDHGLGWVIWVSALISLSVALALAVFAWFAPDYLLKREHPFWRWLWLGLVISEIVIPPTSPARLLSNVCVWMYFCFAECDDPPPPKRKEESKKTTSFWGFLLPSPNPNS